jgi:transposase
MATILGIDLGKFKSVFCLFCEETGEVKYFTLATREKDFRDFLVREVPSMTLFEVSTAAGWVYDLCGELGLACQVANPLGDAWQWKKVKRKTDRDDAYKLIRLYLLNELPTVHMPNAEVRGDRAAVGFRQRLIERRTAICNHIRALFQSEGVELPAGHEAWTKDALRHWRKVFARPVNKCGPDEIWRGLLHVELTLLEALQKQIALVDKTLDAKGKANERVVLLRTIPGVGPRTAEAISAYLDDPDRFANARQVSAYAGLVPRQFQSGTMDRKGRITKRGPAYLRKILVECAWLMRRYNSWGARVVERISRGQKGRLKPAVVALARKLLVRCWAMLRKRQPWAAPEIAPAAS